MPGCVLAMLGIMGAQVAVAVKLVGAVSRNFDAYLLGEKPGP
jgi:hypothetical protein